MTADSDPSDSVPSERAAEHERGRVLGLCVRLTGDPDAAQDLAQETLYEAWRSEHRLRDPARRWEWLAGIARNVCLRWARLRGRELPRLPRGHQPGEEAQRTVEDLPDERFDVEIELEHSELSVLLDRAMAYLHLPAVTRAVLLARLVEDVPQREVAARLGVSEGVVAVRLLRGKVRLREVLTSRLANEAAAYGLVDVRGAWQETRMWCPACGARRLLARFAPDRHGFYVRCPDDACGHAPAYWTESGRFDAARPGFFHGVKGSRPALTRVLKSVHAFHADTTAQPFVVCGCGAPVQPRVDAARLDIATHCARCGSWRRSTVLDLLHALPPAGEFWRRYPRMRTLPPVEVERDGQPHVALTLQSYSGGPRLDAVFARGTLALRAMAENG